MGCHVVKSIISFSNMDAPDTQPTTQSQSTGAAWTQMSDSQPMNVWARLYPKFAKLKSLDLCSDTFTAGRDAANTLQLRREELPEKVVWRISKTHFRISKDLREVSNPVFIEDCSRNGTFVNGTLIGPNQRRILRTDDVISLAHVLYKAFIYKDLSPNEAHGLPPVICEQYHVARKLGSGACGVVRLVYKRDTCEAYAMKHVKKNQLTMNQSQEQQPTTTRSLINEGVIMQSLRHPCVVRMHEVIETADSVFIMLEVMQGGDLLSRIIQRKRLPERVAKLYFLQMCHAVKYLHDKNITHRDLKPDNMLLQTSDDETLLKISDFGLSKTVDNDSVMRTLCGTPLYVAPEVLLTGGRGSYTKKVDVWSLGVVLFTCLSGTLPFSDDYGTAASDQIKRGQFSFRASAWRNVSEAARRLIGKMLTVNANQRFSIDEVLANGWLNDAFVLQKAEAIMKIPLVQVQQENLSPNYCMQPPAAKRRRIEPTPPPPV